MKNDILKELSQNFIEYAVAVNTDRAIPNATDGLKPVAKRIIYCSYDEGFKYEKPHVKCANIVGNTMAYWHPHGDSSIYGALVRLSQPWVMRYPLIDFHGSNGNIDGDGPAANRYTEARLAKITEDGMLSDIKKNCVDYVDNYSETKKEPVELPSIFPNLLCNPNSGIGVAMACSWAPHNLKEVAQAIYDYMDGKEPMLPGPDFPTGGIIINKNDIPNIMRTGHGTVKIRAKYQIEENKIVFTEIPYGIQTEALMNQIGEVCDSGEISGVEDIRNESNKKGFRLVVECAKNVSTVPIISKLFAKTNLQYNFSYNQVALVDKIPTELNLTDCIKVYIDFNTKCIKRATEFEKQKSLDRLHILDGLLKAMEDIDNVIKIIKNSESAAKAKVNLMNAYKFSEAQADAIVNMKLGKLAGLEKIELNKEKDQVAQDIEHFNWILNNLVEELRNRLTALVAKYGDNRKTGLIQLEIPKEEKEIEFVEPEKCVVVMSKNGLIKRVPSASFKTQKRNGKGIKNLGDITSAIIRTNTIDSLMVFSDKGKMYRILVNDIPEGTNATKGQPIKSLIAMETDENPTLIYSIYRNTDAKYVLFVTKNGIVKKTELNEYVKTKKKTGIAAINLKDNDSLASVSLVSDEDIILLTHEGMAIKFNSKDIGATSRSTTGVKGISLGENDYVVSANPVRNSEDQLAIFTERGQGKKIKLEELLTQKRGGKGLIIYKPTAITGKISCGALVSDEDSILIMGTGNSICISAKEIPCLSRGSIGNQLIKSSSITSVSKV